MPEFRKVLPSDDFGAIARIYVHSWRAAYRDIVPQAYLDGLSEARWEENLRKSASDSYVLLLDGQYIGTSAICPARDETMEGWGEVISAYLLPEYFGKGYGKLLLGGAVAALREKGYAQIYLWVLEKNARARVFYERNGFQPTPDRMALSIGGEELAEMRYVSF